VADVADADKAAGTTPSSAQTRSALSFYCPTCTFPFLPSDRAAQTICERLFLDLTKLSKEAYYSFKSKALKAAKESVLA
jgi:hypothetical protein